MIVLSRRRRVVYSALYFVFALVFALVSNIGLNIGLEHWFQTLKSPLSTPMQHTTTTTKKPAVCTHLLLMWLLRATIIKQQHQITVEP